MTAKADLPTHSVAIKVPFHDLDPVGIVWHGNYAKYFEIARCALLETFNYNYDQMAASGFAWPIIDLHMRYVKAARFAETLNIAASLREWEYRLRIDYLVTDASSGLRVCKGTSIQVAVDMKTHEMCLRSPEVIFQRLGRS
jgi:acyl-CoA thioester hydrolase